MRKKYLVQSLFFSLNIEDWLNFYQFGFIILVHSTQLIGPKSSHH